MTRVRCEPLTREAFAPFGAVLAPGAQWVPANDGRARRYPVAGIHRAASSPAGAWLETTIYRIAPSSLPFEVTAFERHPHSAQLFHPASSSPYVVCVCPAAADGAPDLAFVRAFRVEPPAGIVYGPGVWHLPLVALEAEGEFLMQMWSVGGEADSVLHALDRPLHIET